MSEAHSRWRSKGVGPGGTGHACERPTQLYVDGRQLISQCEIDEMQHNRRDVQSDEARAQPEVIDLTGDDSEYDSDIVEVL